MCFAVISAKIRGPVLSGVDKFAPFGVVVWLEFLIVDHLHKVGTLQHTASDKKSKISALEKLGDAGAPANGRVTAQLPKEKVRRPVFMPHQHVPMDEWLRPRRLTPESITMACMKS